jgi:GTP cyclohydrolase IA
MIAKLIADLLTELVGDDATREGLERTPERVDKALRYLTSGYGQDVKDVLNDALFVEEYDEMVVVKDIDFFSLCEHHLLPFFGKCHVAYMPHRKIVGLSKIPRLVEMFSRRLQVQERLTTQIAATLNEALQPRGVAVVMEGVHLCMLMRGVEKQNSKAITSAMLGGFRDRPETRAEFMELIKSSRGVQI